LPTILASLDEDEKTRQIYLKDLKQKKAIPNKLLRLGPEVIQTEFPEFVLTDEIAGGHFRNIKPSYNLVKNQFKRFQERNLVEPRKKNKYKPRYKKKSYEVRSYKGD